MATIYVDGQRYEVDEGENLLRTCLCLGFDIPYFCWHPALGAIGACRQCAVKQYKDEADTEGKIVMSCMTPVKDGVRISIKDPEVAEFRASVIEWLMVNHPHDCPVCDEGGECHLQDMTVLTGHAYRRFRFNKRTHHNQDLGPFVNHEMNRCIVCYRCVRYYREIAGGRDLDAHASHDYVYFGRHEDGVLQSEFSGNLVEVCPTGVFTDKTLRRHYTRKWDLQTAPSVCVHCGLGCNTIPGERYGMLRRIRNRYHREVNGYWLCDRGRYGYEFVNSDQRIREPLWRDKKGATQIISKEEALKRASELVGDGKRVIGIGSPRASLEANYALLKLVGPDNFYAGASESDYQLINSALRIMQQGPVRVSSLHDVSAADTVLVLGEDATSVAPLLDLALRQSAHEIPMEVAEKLLHIHEWQDAAVQEAIQLEVGPLVIATTGSTKLDEVATQTVRLAPDDLARLGFAVAHAICDDAPAVADLSDEMLKLASHIAKILMQGERPLVVSGISCGCVALMEAAANVASALCNSAGKAGLFLTVPECNSLGLGLLPAKSLAFAHEAISRGDVDTVIIVENDLYRRALIGEIDTILSAPHVIVIDYLNNRTVAKAELVLPAATFAECEGTLVNNEGRAQRFYQVFVPAGNVQPTWRWISEVSASVGQKAPAKWHMVDDAIAAMAAEFSLLAPVAQAAPPADFRVAGQKIAREPHRYTARTAMHANANVSEPQPPADPDSPFAFSMEGYEGEPPSALVPRYWAPHWNSMQALNKLQEPVGGALRNGDPGQRLLNTPEGEPAYFTEVPPPFEPRPGQWLFIQCHQIFGSEPLSMFSPGVASLAPQPYVSLNRQDAQSMGLEEKEQVTVTVGNTTWTSALRLDEELPPGIAEIPVGLPGMPVVELPDWGTIEKGKKS